MSSWDYDNWYLNVGGVLGGLAGFVTFVGSWIYCIVEYGYLLGVGLGWLPSIIVAAVAFFGVMYLWGPVLLLVGVVVYLVLR